MKILKRFFIFFVVFILYHIILSNFFPVNEENILIAPDWYVSIGLLLATTIAVFWEKIPSLTKKLKITVSQRYTERIIPPDIEPVAQYLPNIRSLSQEPVLIPNSPSPENNSCTKSPLESIDTMDGHEFEYWCADLLRKNGFLNVSVTKGSGDQGVDVLAEKEGIHYAIQCKCYSHDLGNKPIQEVYTGKRIYGCQIGAVMTNQHFTSGAKEAAKKTGTLLWDRDWILDHVQEKESLPSPSISTISDNMLWDAWAVIKESGNASESLLERRLKIGYARAGRIIDELEELGYIGPFVGSKPREILK